MQNDIEESPNKLNFECEKCKKETNCIIKTVEGRSICNECNMKSAKPIQYEYGWICPQCNLAHSPWINTCNCISGSEILNEQYERDMQ